MSLFQRFFFLAFLLGINIARAGEVTIGVNSQSGTVPLGYTLYSYQQFYLSHVKPIFYAFNPFQVWKCASPGQREIRIPDFTQMQPDAFLGSFGCFDIIPEDQFVRVRVNQNAYVLTSDDGISYYWCGCSSADQLVSANLQFQNLEMIRLRQRR